MTHSTRFDKFGWLLDNCSDKFINDSIFLSELVGWMSENDFNEFYDHMCRNWGIDSPMVEGD